MLFLKITLLTKRFSQLYINFCRKPEKKKSVFSGISTQDSGDSAANSAVYILCDYHRLFWRVYNISRPRTSQQLPVLQRLYSGGLFAPYRNRKGHGYESLPSFNFLQALLSTAKVQYNSAAHLSRLFRIFVITHFI